MANVILRCVCPVLSRSWTPHLLQASLLHSHTAQLNSNRTSVVCHGRRRFERLYPVMLVCADGSTLNIRYNEPRRILMMPVDINTLSEEERRARQKKKAVKKIKEPVMIEYEDSFRADAYSHMWKKKK